MFGDLDWPLNALCGLSASGEFLVLVLSRINVEDGGQDLSHIESLQVYVTHLDTLLLINRSPRDGGLSRSWRSVALGEILTQISWSYNEETVQQFTTRPLAHLFIRA